MELNSLQYTDRNAKSVPIKTGVGLRSVHYKEIIETRPDIGWFEIHSENYFGAGGQPLHYLDQISSNYPLSIHTVGLSLGSKDELKLLHLSKLKKLVNRYSPIFVSEHLCWSSIGRQHLHDLLPLPYTEESMSIIISHINQVQEYLNRQILIENISSYLQYVHSTIIEYEFITEIANRTGCGILLDISNLYVNSVNHGWDADIYLQEVPVDLVQEIHLGGFTENHFDKGSILIDSHNNPVSLQVWQLYHRALQRFGYKPTLIEWDKDIPPLAVLIQEAQKANNILDSIHAAAC
ncbi:MAG: DUF692 domain-containing protein [Candidatus Berkiella sp.]